MVDFKKLQEIDTLLNNINLVQDKAKIIAEDLRQEYFSLTKDEYKLFYYDDAVIKNDIVHDYIFEAVQNMSKLLEIFGAVFKEARDEKRSGGAKLTFLLMPEGRYS